MSIRRSTSGQTVYIKESHEHSTLNKLPTLPAFRTVGALESPSLRFLQIQFPPWFLQSFLEEHPNLAIKSEEREVLSWPHQSVTPVFFDATAANAHFLQLSLTTPARRSTSSPRSYDRTGHSDIGVHTGDDAAKMLLHIFQRAGADVLELPADAEQQLFDHQPENVLAM